MLAGRRGTFHPHVHANIRFLYVICDGLEISFNAIAANCHHLVARLATNINPVRCPSLRCRSAGAPSVIIPVAWFPRKVDGVEETRNSTYLFPNLLFSITVVCKLHLRHCRFLQTTGLLRSSILLPECQHKAVHERAIVVRVIRGVSTRGILH